MGFAYGHDLNGNRLFKRFADGTQETYSYDSANRLVHVTYRDGKFEDFLYDLLGNRVLHNKDGVNTNSTFNAFNQLLTATNTSTGEVTTFTWDGNGNLVSETSVAGVKSYLWDFDNRLRQITMPDGTASAYTYAPSGLRVSKSENGVVRQKLVSDAAVLAEYDDAGTWKGRYSWNPNNVDELFSSKFILNGLASKFWPISDAIGSIVSLSDKSGSLFWSSDYRAFGERRAGDGSTAAFASGFTGREHDSSALVYHRDRYLSASKGVWIQPDRLDTMWNLGNIAVELNSVAPSGTAQIRTGFVRAYMARSSPNAYSYAALNPVLFTDPAGLTPCACESGRLDCPGGAWVGAPLFLVEYDLTSVLEQFHDVPDWLAADIGGFAGVYSCLGGVCQTLVGSICSFVGVELGALDVTGAAAVGFSYLTSHNCVEQFNGMAEFEGWVSYIWLTYYWSPVEIGVLFGPATGEWSAGKIECTNAAGEVKWWE